MRLPMRNGRVVSAISEIRRLVPRQTPEPYALRAEVLKLYRSIIRTLWRAPPSQVRTDTYQHARREFEQHAYLSDPIAIQHRIHTGNNEYKMFRHYFDEQRHFAKPLLKKEYPHRRVEVLKQLLTVTPEHKRRRVRLLLKRAEERVAKVEGLQRVLESAEKAADGSKSFEYEWQGWLARMRTQMEAEKASSNGTW